MDISWSAQTFGLYMEITQNREGDKMQSKKLLKKKSEVHVNKNLLYIILYDVQDQHVSRQRFLLLSE